MNLDWGEMFFIANSKVAFLWRIIFSRYKNATKYKWKLLRICACLGRIITFHFSARNSRPDDIYDTLSRQKREHGAVAATSRYNVLAFLRQIKVALALRYGKARMQQSPQHRSISCVGTTTVIIQCRLSRETVYNAPREPGGRYEQLVSIGYRH